MKSKIVFVNPSILELNFFISVGDQLSEKYDIYWITYDINRKVNSEKIYYIDTKNTNVEKEYDTTTILGISAENLIKCDRLFFDKSPDFLYSVFYQIDGILESIKPDLIYTGVGGELIRSSIYYFSMMKKYKTAIHGYFGVKNRIVFFDNPFNYNLYQINNKDNNISSNEGTGFIKLDPEVRNLNIFNYIANRLKNINSISFLKVYRFINEIAKIMIRNIRKILLNIFIYKKTQEINSTDNFLFPMHLYDDFVIDILNPQFKNQIKLIYNLENIIPNNSKLIVKEHPYDMYGYKFSDYYKLTKKNVVFINPNEDSMDVLKCCKKGLITICSTFAIEAAYLNLPIFLLGNSFYKKYGFTNNIQTENNLNPEINLDTQNSNFKEFIDFMYNNSFDAPLPYLDKPISAANNYANAINVLMNNIK